MALVHPFHRVDGRPSRRRRTPRSGAVVPSTASGDAAPVGASRPVDTPTGRPATGIPRELAVDESGRPRRAVLLAAIMIRRGRSVEAITTATGLPVDVVTRLVPGT